jgi:hypothetical protein
MSRTKVQSPARAIRLLGEYLPDFRIVRPKPFGPRYVQASVVPGQLRHLVRWSDRQEPLATR